MGGMDLTEASETARRVRALYHRLEERQEGGAWSAKDDMLGLVNDVGTLSRLVMATGGQWAPEGDVPAQLRDKLAECLWWVLVLADRLDVDITDAYASKLEAHLESVVSRLPPG
jgi:NTP pyrophosphatase (non-canonical NTP hydrolase)